MSHVNEHRNARSQGIKRITLNFFFMMVMIVLTGFGCITSGKKIIQPGDRVEVNFNCRLANGDLVYTTHQTLAPEIKPHFANPALLAPPCEPVTLIAGEATEDSSYGKFRIFKKEVRNQIARQLPGKKTHTTYRLELTAKTPAGLSDQERYVSLTRMRKFEKQQTIPMKEFMRGRETKPVAGEIIINEKGLLTKIVQVAEDSVVMSSTYDKGTTTDLIFGKGTFHDRGEYYEMVIDAKDGHILLSGPIVARITDVTDQTFKLDFGNPFGGETLFCEVIVGDSIVEKQKEKK